MTDDENTECVGPAVRQGEAAGCEASSQGGSASVRPTLGGQSWGTGQPPAQGSRPPARRCFFLSSPACAGLSAPSRTACFVNESPLAEVRPAPHVTPALPQLQASPPTPRARSPGFGDHSDWAPLGRGRSRLTNEPSPHPHASREAITLPAGVGKEATSEHSETRHQRRKRTQCPGAAQKGPLLDGEGVGQL